MNQGLVTNVCATCICFSMPCSIAKIRWCSSVYDTEGMGEDNYQSNLLLPVNILVLIFLPNAYIHSSLD
jgi:hypothetical protein